MLAPKYWSWCATNPTPQGPGTFDRDPGPVAKTESTRATPGRSSKSTTGRFERRWNVIEIFWVACICEGCLKLFDLFVILCVCSQCWNNVGRSNENESDSCPAGSLLVKAHFFLGMCDIVPYPCWVQQSDVYIFSFFPIQPSSQAPLFRHTTSKNTQFETKQKDTQQQNLSGILHTKWFCMRFVQFVWFAPCCPWISEGTGSFGRLAKHSAMSLGAAAESTASSRSGRRPSTRGAAESLEVGRDDELSVYMWSYVYL